jgi:hypothetical protein
MYEFLTTRIAQWMLGKKLFLNTVQAKQSHYTPEQALSLPVG